MNAVVSNTQMSLHEIVREINRSSGLNVTWASFQRMQNRWAEKHACEIEEAMREMGVAPTAQEKIPYSIFLRRILLEELTPTLKAAVLCIGDSRRTSMIANLTGSNEQKLSTIDSTIERVVGLLESSHLPTVHMPALTFFHGLAIDALEELPIRQRNPATWIRTFRDCTDAHVEVSVPKMACAMATRGVRGLLDFGHAETDAEADSALTQIRSYYTNMLDCYGVVEYGARNCLRAYQRRALAFIDGEEGLESVKAGLCRDIHRCTNEFYCNALKCQEAHKMALKTFAARLSASFGSAPINQLAKLLVSNN